jgi:hypothetical protein
MEYFQEINFGCGNDLIEKVLNIDIENPEPSILKDHQFLSSDLTDPQQLPRNYFKKIIANMVFEHIHPDIIPTVIYVMSNILAPGGEVHVTVPNFEFFVRKINMDKKFDIQKLMILREATFQLLDPQLKLRSGRGHQSLWCKDLAEFWFGGEGFIIEHISDEGPVLRFLAVKSEEFSIAKGIL